MLFDRLKRRRARKLAEHVEQARQIKERAWAIFRDVTAPVASDRRATLSHPVTEGFGKYGTPDEWIGVQPSREGAAAVAISCEGTGWIDFAVGEPFPVGSVYELNIVDGWEEELGLCLEAVIDGRYRERVHKARLGEVHEMIFDLPTGERRIDTQDLSGEGFDLPMGEHHFASY